MTRPPQLSFEELLTRDEALLLDGGLATELEVQGFDIDSPLWSAELLLSRPQAIIDVHRTFLDAGAVGLISASYQMSALGLSSVGLEEQQLEPLLHKSVRLALQARDEFVAQNTEVEFLPFVAASVGPYGAALADGSEYTGAYGVDDATLRGFHSERVKMLDASGADVLACETIPSQPEAQVLSDLLQEVTTPAWVSFSCRDGTRLNDGSSIRSCAELFAQHPRVLALGVNCTSPRHISSLIGELRGGAPNKAVVVYPNSGERFDAGSRTWQGTANPGEYGAAAREWRERGATLLGGCCRIGPAHIRAMREKL